MRSVNLQIDDEQRPLDGKDRFAVLVDDVDPDIEWNDAWQTAFVTPFREDVTPRVGIDTADLLVVLMAGDRRVLTASTGTCVQTLMTSHIEALCKHRIDNCSALLTVVQAPAGTRMDSLSPLWSTVRDSLREEALWAHTLLVEGRPTSDLMAVSVVVSEQAQA